MSTKTLTADEKPATPKKSSAPSFSLRRFYTLWSREVMSYFYSPIAYVVMFFFLIATGWSFISGVSILNQTPSEVTVVEVAFGSVLFWFPLLLIFPLLTMRTYADEFRAGTIETLTTAPVQDWEVVLSKFAGALFFYCILWLPSAFYFVGFEAITDKPAALSGGAFFGSYLLLFLIGMFFTSIGCLSSCINTEQINAAVMSFVVIFGVFCLGLIGYIVNVTDPAVRNLISFFSAPEHMVDFSKGTIDSRTIIWYASLTLLMLVINFQVFQYRKWKA